MSAPQQQQQEPTEHVESPAAFLHSLAQRPPSHDVLPQLALGLDVISTPELSAAYLNAVARHLPKSSLHTTAETSTTAPSGATVRTRSSLEIEGSQHLALILAVRMSEKCP